MGKRQYYKKKKQINYKIIIAAVAAGIVVLGGVIIFAISHKSDDANDKVVDAAGNVADESTNTDVVENTDVKTDDNETETAGDDTSIISPIYAEHGMTKTSTIKEFLKIALQPVGSTVYIWGGGWNEEDTAAGDDAKRIGVNPNWKAFFEKQDSSYDYNTTRYQWGNGLDCTGYVGWCVYNAFNTEAGHEGFVYKSSSTAQIYSEMEFGSYTDRANIIDYKPGDIMSSTCDDCGHVWISLGQCDDGSVVLMHSSPPGVRIAGTTTAAGEPNSQAVELATKYMEEYYPEWYVKFPNCAVDSAYLSHYSAMRWYIGEDKLMTDPDGILDMKPEEVLQQIFE